MKRMKQTIALVGMMALLFAVTFTAQAQGRGGGQGKGRTTTRRPGRRTNDGTSRAAVGANRQPVRPGADGSRSVMRAHDRSAT
jgi:hypothetical protein